MLWFVLVMVLVMVLMELVFLFDEMVSSSVGMNVLVR